MNIAASEGVDAMINQFISHADRERDEVDACIHVTRWTQLIPVEFANSCASSQSVYFVVCLGAGYSGGKRAINPGL
jgi:hypothetical protein